MFITKAKTAIVVVLLPVAVKEDNITVSVIIGRWLEGKDVGGNTVQKEAIMGHCNDGSSEGKKCVLEGTEGGDICGGGMNGG